MNDFKSIFFLSRLIVEARQELNGRFVLVLGSEGRKAGASFVEKSLPRADGLVRPDPEAARYAHDQKHGILKHEYPENQRTTVVFEQARVHIVGRQIKFDEIFSQPIVGPLAERRLLVKVATNHNYGRYYVQYAEHANAEHEFFQLFRVVVAMFHYDANAKERYEAGEQKAGAQNEIEQERRQHERLHEVHVAHTGEAHAAQNVRVDFLQPQDDYELEAGYGPGGQVKVGRYVLDGFVAPLESSGQKPGQCEYYPPGR